MKRALPCAVLAIAAVVVASISVTSEPAAASPTPAPAVATAAVTTPGGYQPVTPARVIDTRTGLGAAKARVGAYRTVVLAIGGRAGVPSGVAESVALHVTAVSPTAAGSIDARYDPTQQPGTSNLNFVAGQTVGNLVIAPVNGDGNISLNNSSPGVVDLVVDVQGYWVKGYTQAAGSFYGSPHRRLDTRLGIGSPKAPLAAWGTRDLDLRSGFSVQFVGTVAVNFTVVNPTRSGTLTVWPSGTPKPTTPNVYFAAGQRIANVVIVPLGTPVATNGRVSMYNGSGGTADLVADVIGAYLPREPAAAGTLGTLAPARILDTRFGYGAPKAAVPAYGTTSLKVTGRGGVPATNVSAVLLNVTVTHQTHAGRVTVWAGGTARPNVSSLDFPAGETTSTLVVAPVGADGTVSLANSSAGSADLIGDVTGYFLTAHQAATTGPRTTILIIGTDAKQYPEGDTFNPGGLDNLTAWLTDAGYTVTLAATVPASVSSYGQVWDFGGDPKTAAQETVLENYLTAGGSLYLTGDFDPTQCPQFCDDPNVKHIVDAVLPGLGGIQFGPYYDFEPPDEAKLTATVNPTAIDDITTVPNTLSTLVTLTGTLTPASVAPVNRVLTDQSGNTAVAAWDGADLPGDGRLVLFNTWTYPAYANDGGDTANAPSVVGNVAYFLSHPVS